MIQEAPADKKQQMLLEYCKLCFRMVEDEVLTKEEAGYRMCGWGLQVLDDLDERGRGIVALAGRLELPSLHRGPEDSWDRLVQMVESAS